MRVWYGWHTKGEAGGRSNTRNGKARRRLKGSFDEIEVNTPRDRAGTFEPVLVKKRQTRLGDFEDTILALHARGTITRDIESALVDLYGVTAVPVELAEPVLWRTPPAAGAGTTRRP